MKFKSISFLIAMFILIAACNNANERYLPEDESYNKSEVKDDYEDLMVISESQLSGSLQESSEEYDSDGNKTIAMQFKGEASGYLSNAKKSDYISSSAAVSDSKDSSKLFIRTAELKFRVKDVYQSTLQIEDIVSKQHGYITENELKSRINNVELTPISADSSLETTKYTVSNTLIIRIPVKRLDATLRKISDQIDFLDFRTIKAEDISLKIKANRLIRENATKTEERITGGIDNKGKKLYDITYAEELRQRKKEEADRALISNLNLFDQIQYSTVHVQIYQRESLKREMIPNEKNIDAYQPGFGKKFLDSLKTGWLIVSVIFLFLAKLWGLILFVILIIVLYRLFGHMLKK